MSADCRANSRGNREAMPKVQLLKQRLAKLPPFDVCLIEFLQLPIGVNLCGCTSPNQPQQRVQGEVHLNIA